MTMWNNVIVPLGLSLLAVGIIAALLFTIALIDSIVRSKFDEIRHRKIIKRELRKKVDELYEIMIDSVMIMLDNGTIDTNDNDSLEIDIDV